ncbi:outer dense fiber protein 4 isoform X1 [Notamacropus eugenii]|uniref:outer dense fiber protein 4 isoform X1 n=2 Tax=Notamacropus eugenii TaxID=9315 RepID=UPI003B68358C
MESFNRQTTSHFLGKWSLLYHFRWLSRMASAELSFTGFILQLIMTFYHQWVYMPMKIFNETTDSRDRSHSYGGLWDYCTIQDCSNNSSSEKSKSFCIFLEMAKMTFLFSLSLSFLLTIWFHCISMTLEKNFQKFDCNGGLVNVLAASCVFFTLILFPVHLWIQEMTIKRRFILDKIYYLGWLVFLIYIVCATLCFLNNRIPARMYPQPQSRTNSL